MLLAAATALASAACFAGGSAMQHRVAGESSASRDSGPDFLAHLVRRPSWLIGLALSAVAFGLHALALRFGQLSVVQPVIVSGVVFAVVIRAALSRRFPPRRTIVWLILTWAGLAVFLLVKPPAETRSANLEYAAFFVAVGSMAGLLLVFSTRWVSRDRYRGVLFGAAAGVLFGLVAGLAKIVISRAADGWSELLLNWPTWALLVVGAGAVFVNQRAYQATKLSVSAPVLNIVQVVVALIFGILVLSEHPGSSIEVITGQLAGLVLVGLGIWKLASQPQSEREPQDTRESAAV
jgi:hypothetical protein